MKFQTSTKEKSEAFEKVRLPEDIYTAEFVQVKDISDGQYGQRVAFIFKVENHELALVCYKTKATKDNKLGQTILALGGQINDQEVDVDKFKGTLVRAWVEDYEATIKRDGKEEKQMASTISKIKQIVEKV